MSLFDRNVKLHLNKIKYKSLVEKTLPSPAPLVVPLNNAVRSRLLMLIFGWGCGFSLLNYDVYWYKTTRGLARWKNRVLSLFGLDNGHGHGHGHH